MRLCYIADGKSIHTQRWLEYFSDKGHNIALLTDSPGTHISPGIEQHIIGKKEATKIQHYFQCVSQIKTFIKKWKPEILHGHFISGYGYWAEMSGFHPLVQTAWGSDIYLIPEHNPISRILTKRALSQADLVTADSFDLMHAIKILQPKTKKTELVFFGVNTRKFKFPSDKEFLKHNLGWGGKILILSNRQLEPLYHIETIIQAMQILKISYPNLHLLIINNGSEREKLEALTFKLSVDMKVEFLDNIPHEELPPYLQAADIYITIPTTDGTSASLLEAMACGVPIIASDIASNREWIKNMKNGFLIPPGNPEALSQAIILILSGHYNMNEMSITNRQIILEKAEFIKHMEKMELLYKNLIKKKK